MIANPIRELREILDILKEVLHLEEENRHLLRRLLHHSPHNRIDGFVIVRETPMNPITPGTSAIYTAVPVPAGAVPSTPPTWVSSDPTNAPVTADSTGLIGTVEAVAPTTFTLTVSYTNEDGTVATGTVTDEVVAATPPVNDITSFTVSRTS